MTHTLRQEAVDRISNPPAVADLGIDADDEKPKKRAKLDLSQISDVITIQLPALDGGNCGVAAKVLKGVGRDPVWVELTSEVIGHLAALVRATKQQDADGDRLARDDGPQARAQHIAYCTQRGAYRVRYMGTSKWFPTNRFADALHEAQSFLRQLQSCPQPRRAGQHE